MKTTSKVARRRRRVRTLAAKRLSTREIVDRLQAEGVLRSISHGSAERTIRADLAAVRPEHGIPKPPAARSVNVARRRARVRELVALGLTNGRELAERLTAEGLLTSRSSESACRTVRADVCTILQRKGPARPMEGVE